MGNYDEMKVRIKEGGGVAVATLGELREAIHQQRLGPYVLEAVAERLHQEGIEFFPAWVIKDNSAPRQHHSVRLVDLNPSSPIYKAVRAVEDPTDDGDDFLRGLATSSPTATAARIEDQLKRVRGALEDAVAILDEPEDADAV